MPVPSWRFRRMHPSEMSIDPIEAEFFSTEALGSFADALVREAIQNSLDARLPGEALRIRISFCTNDTMLRGPRRDAYLGGLGAHLRASSSGVSADVLPTRDEPLSYLTLEDFGTRGLQGDPKQSDDTDIEIGGAARNDFFFFWRNVGRSRKQAGDLGRWGLGKTVFPAASRVNAFFAMTVRANDRRRLLLGQAVLKIHRLGDTRFYPYGYFADFADDFALPIESPDFLDRFARDFALERRSESGLSVVLPYPDPSLTPSSVISSVVRHYFMPILSGDLAVEVAHDSKLERIDAGSLARMFAASDSADAANAGLARVFDLARWGMALLAEGYVALRAPEENVAPRWQDDAIGDDSLRALRDALAAGGRIAVRIPVWVKPAHAASTLSSFDIYLERDDAIERSDEHFVRDGITVTGVRAGLPKGIRAIVVIRDKALSSLLGDSENPAHTEWQERSPKFKDRYRHGAFTLRYVKSVPRELVRLLTRPVEGRDYALLRQLFSLEIPTESDIVSRAADVQKRGTGEESEAEAPDTVGKDRQFVLQRLRGGFRIRGSASDSLALPAAAVNVAYEVRRGNPFRQYHALDFDLAKSPIEVQSRGLAIARCEGNLLAFRAQAPDFDVVVRGFDPHRDLRVRVVPVDEAAP
jgi:hypothetical protein